jgi:bacteriophage N4 adsorption protein A
MIKILLPLNLNGIKRLIALAKISLAIAGTLSLPGFICAEDNAPAASETYTVDQQKTHEQDWFHTEVRKFQSYARLDHAYRLINDNKLPEARNELTLYLQANPKDARAQMALLMVLVKLHDDPEAIKQADVVLRGQPGTAYALLCRGQAHEALLRLDEALADFDAVAANSANSPTDRFFAYNAVANIALRVGKNDTALAALGELKKTHQDFSLHFRQGLAFEAAGRLPEANSAYKLALESAAGVNDRSSALRATANVEKKQGQLTESQADLKRLLKLQPGNLEVLKALTDNAYQSHDYPEASQWARSVVSADPSFKNREYLAEILATGKHYREAVEEYKKLAADATDPEARRRSFLNVGYSYSNLGSHDRAAEAFRKAASIRTDSIVNAALAESLDQTGQTSDAINVWKSELAIRPSTQIELKLGNLYAKSGNDVMAAEHLERAASQNESGELHYRLGMLYAKTGSTDMAITHLEKAVRANLPSDTTRTAYEQQGYLYAQMKVHDKSVDAFRKADEIQSDPKVTVALAQELELGGRVLEAIQSLENAPQRSNSIEIQSRLANLYVKAGNNTSAIQTFEKSLEVNDSAETHYRLGILYAAKGEPDEARRQLDIAVAGTLPSELVPAAYEQLGDLYLERKQPDEAAESFQRAIDAGATSPRVQQGLGYALFSLGRWDQALREFLSVSSQEPSAVSMLEVARCYQQLNQTGMSIQYVRLAIDATSPENSNERRMLYDELGYLQTSQADYASSVESWTRSLELSADPAISLSQARSLRLTGKLEDAERKLVAIPAAELSVDQQAKRFDELAQVYQSQNQPDAMINAMVMAEGLQPSANREYRLGALYTELKRPNSAIQEYEYAVGREPGNLVYEESLAYAYRSRRRYGDAARVFETIIKQHPDRSALYPDLAYSYLHEGENARAAYWFERAIDVQPQPTSYADQQQKRRDAFGMQEEISSLTTRYSLTLYQSYRGNDVGMSSSSLFSGGGVIPSQGGVEISFQPGQIGFRDDKIFQVFARTLWSNEPQSLTIDENSVQVGVGVRYKPFRSQNILVSAERLIAVGSNAINSWLFRASYGWGTGYELRPGQHLWNNTQVYGDVGLFTRNGGTGAYYAEARQGLTLNLHDRILVTPHIVLDGRNQTPDRLGVSYLEGGAGVAIKYLFNASRYETHRANLEFLIEYKHGFLPGVPGGLVFTTAWRFSGGSPFGRGIRNSGIQ